MLYRERTGCPWRDLPSGYGDDHTIYGRWQRWVKGGVPQRVMVTRYLAAAKAGKLDLSLALVDSTIVRAHPHAAGARKKNGPQALGRSRGGLSPKIHAVAVSECQVLGVILGGGQEGDAPVGEEMLAEVLTRPEIKAVGADRAYDRDTIRAMIAAAGKEAVIPLRSNRVDPPDYDKQKYKERNKAERLFCKLRGYRAVATRYDKLAAMFLGGVLAALLAVSLKGIVNTP